MQEIRHPRQIDFATLRLGARPDLEEPDFQNHELPRGFEFRLFCEREGIVMDGGSASASPLEYKHNAKLPSDPPRPDEPQDPFCRECGEFDCTTHN